MSENNVFKLESGAGLWVTMAPFADCKRLHDEVVKVFLQNGGTMKELLGGEMLPLILMGASSAPLEQALFKCAERALYSVDGEESTRMKVDRALFDTPTVYEKTREDYYPIFLKVAEVNLRPFMKALISGLKMLRETAPAIPEQK